MVGPFLLLLRDGYRGSTEPRREGRTRCGWVCGVRNTPESDFFTRHARCTLHDEAGWQQRLPPKERVGGRLKAELAAASCHVEVVEDGLCGRTAGMDDPFQFFPVNGREQLVVSLATHKPIDAVVIMLGTNDTKEFFNASAPNIARCISFLVDIVQRSRCGKDGSAPQVVLVCPARVVQTAVNESWGFGEQAATKSRLLSAELQQVAKDHNISCIDAHEAGVRVSLADGVHLDASGHAKLAEALANVLSRLFCENLFDEVTSTTTSS